MLTFGGIDLGFILPILLFVVIFFWFRHHHKMRRAALLELASLLSFDYQPTASFSNDILPWEFGLFRELNKPSVNHYFKGKQDGINVHMFEISPGDRDKNQPKSDTILVFEKDSWDLPTFTLQINGSQPIRQLMIEHDIELNDDKKFNKQFYLRGEEIEEVIRLMKMWRKDLLKNPMYIESKLNRLVFCKPGNLPVIQLERHLHKCIDLTNIIDEYSPP